MSEEPITPAGTGDGAVNEPHILELRIHGVRNTPPWDVLGVAEADAIMVAGDNLGSFWIPQRPDTSSGMPPQHGSEVPVNVRREAYSWGAMARFAPVPGANLMGKAAAVIRSVGWLMMLPFALCNAAYWMRPLAEKPGSTGDGAESGEGRGWRDAHGGGLVRVFGLFLTLLLVATATAASVDLLGNQCVQKERICSTLPGIFNGLTALEQLQRNMILALLPLVMLLTIYALSVLGRVRYSANVAAHQKNGTLPSGTTPSGTTASGTTASAENSTPSRPILKTEGFWYSPTMPRATEQLHLAGAGALMTAMLAWDALYSTVLECREISTFFGPLCGAGFNQGTPTGGQAADAVSAFSARPWALVVLIFSLAILATVTCRVLVSVTGNADVHDPKISGSSATRSVELMWAVTLLSGAAALGVVNGILMWIDPKNTATVPSSVALAPQFLGVVWTPSLLILVMLGLSIAGLGWRRGAGSILSLLIFGGAVAGFIGGRAMLTPQTPSDDDYLGWVLYSTSAGLLICLAVHVLRKRREVSIPNEGWQGMGPGVIMILALGFALGLSSALVVGTANFLSGNLSLAGGAGKPADWRAVNGADLPEALVAPTVKEVPIYDHFGLAILFTVTVVGAVLGCAVLRQIWRKPVVLSTPTPNSMPIAGVSANDYEDGRPAALRSPLGNVTHLVLKGRRNAGLLHRVEPALGWLAGTFLLALVGSLAWSFLGAYQPQASSEGVLFWTQRVPATTLGLLAILLVGGFAVGATSTTIRPLGLLWDLMSFLPNAAHPFGPPCYAERVVPELSARIDDWLGAPPVGVAARNVVISAHSLGAVLIVACLFARAAEGKDLQRIGLLTYGCQLRAYFGRFFPELFGPEVLGTAGSLGSSLCSVDPWNKQLNKDFSEPSPEASMNPQLGVADDSWTLAQILGKSESRVPRWINLWRRTDYLGFPINSYKQNDIDRGADELDTSSYLLKLATHSDYPASRAYPAAMTELLARMNEPTTHGET